MELRDYLTIVRKRWVAILLVTVLAVAAAAALAATTPPMYQARSQVFVSVQTGATTSDLLQGSNFTRNQVKSYVDLVTSPRVLQPVIAELGLAETSDELARSIGASSPLDTVLINVTVSRRVPTEAAEIANAVADSLSEEVIELERPDEGPSPVQLSTVRDATVPEIPVSPSLERNVLLGLLLGLAAGFGVAVLKEILNTKVRDEDDIRAVTDASVIAIIDYDDSVADHPLIVQEDPHSVRSEAFRRLRTNLQFLNVGDDRPRVFAITSSLPGEGKSTTAMNLAIALADSGSRVVLVDADLRRSTIADSMGIEGRVGLTTVLIGRATLTDVLQPWGDDYLHILASGQIPPNPSELLGSHAMAVLLEELAREFDIVLIDTPPLLPVTDAAIVARLTGGALMVVGADKLQKHQLVGALGSLERVDAPVLGIVMNRVRRKRQQTYEYYGSRDEEQDRRNGRAGRKNRKGRWSGKGRRSRSGSGMHDWATTTSAAHVRPRRGLTRGAGSDATATPSGRVVGAGRTPAGKSQPNVAEPTAASA